MGNGLCWTLLLLRFSLVRAIHYLNPSTVTVDQAFTVTWFDPPATATEFGIGIPNDDFSSSVNLDNLTPIKPAGQRSGTLTLSAPSTTGKFNFGAYLLRDLNVLGMSDQILAVDVVDDVPASLTTSFQDVTVIFPDDPDAPTSQFSPAPTSSSTSDTPSIEHPDSKHPTDIAKIVGGVSAGVVFVLLAVVFLFYRRQRAEKRRNRSIPSMPIDPFRFWERHSPSVSNVADTRGSTEIQGGNESIAAISNRNSQIRVPRQYRSGPDVFKKIKGKIQSGDAVNQEIDSQPAHDLQNEIQNPVRHIGIKGTPPRDPTLVSLGCPLSVP
ncbi:hypothetical protein VKT23_007750 [Stygiomarasmius scandens]|uniref:Mid2 domain-containing protein n=1 Tax=Marasmiellus scandens TaxID=2682957 RepID=A0ABR1JIW6_9AGAR